MIPAAILTAALHCHIGVTAGTTPGGITARETWACDRNPHATAQVYLQRKVAGHWRAIPGTTLRTPAAHGAIGVTLADAGPGTYRAVARLRGGRLRLLAITRPIVLAP